MHLATMFRSDVVALAIGAVPAGAAMGAIVRPVGGTTDAPIGNGAIANVIDGVPEITSFLQLGQSANGPFTGPYSGTFDLGGSFDLTGMSLWNNAGDRSGGVEFDGEGIDGFELRFLNAAQSQIGTFNGVANDGFARQEYSFGASAVSYIQLVINSNHQENSPRQ